MITFASAELLKSVVSRRISHLIRINSMLKYSSLLRQKNSGLRSSNYHSQNYTPALKCGYKTCGLHRHPIRGSDISTRVLGNVPHRSYKTKSKDFCKDDDNLEIESKARNILDDLEFQSILKDFAHDFGVNDEANKVLEEIKKKHSSSDDKTENPKCKTINPNHQLDFKMYDESRTESVSSPEDKYLGFNDQNSAEASPPEEIQEDSVEDFFHIDQELEEKPIDYDVKRGKTGVYDIDQLVTVLREENLFNISVIQIPESFHYADYLVLATAKSPRHCNAVMEFIIKLYKKKKGSKDSFVKCEGSVKMPSWKALDMGNIILHVFLEDTRNYYDIESLWLLDRKYDSAGSVKSDPEMDMIQRQLDFLNTFNSQ